MTFREAFEYSLVEVNKRKAPTLLRTDYNYLFLKAFYNYANIRYNDYDKNQQRVDDLEALKIVDYEISLSPNGRFYAGTLPVDYFHILGCEVIFESRLDVLCDEKGKFISKTANRLPSGAAKNVNENYYFKPSFKKPYFYSNNNLLEIRSGATNQYVPIKMYIDYLKTPEKLELTQDHIEDIEDNSQILPYSDYVCFQIINELVKLLLENSSDPRIQTNIPVNQTVA